MEKRLFQWKFYIFLFLAHLAYAIIHMERLNLSIAIVAMVSWANQTKITKADGTDSDLVGKFQWDQAHQGILLSAFFYGYILLQLPGGILVDKYGGKTVCGVGLFLSSFFTAMTPLAAINSFPLAILARVCLGLSQGITYSALLLLLRNWSTSQDKNQVLAITTSGMETGSILAFFLGGILCDSDFLDGWPAVFFVFGAMGFVWYAVWMTLVTETPPQSGPKHESDEILLLKHSTLEKNIKIKVPWLKILSSTPLWAVIIGKFCQDWIWTFIVTELPLYYKQVLDISVIKGGLFSTFPVIAAFLTHTVSGFLSDYLQRKWFSVKTTRRLLVLLGFFPTALLMVVVSYTKPGEYVQAVVYITLCAGVSRLNKVTFLSNIIDLSPTFTGILLGFSNTVSLTAAIAVPLLTGFFTNPDPSPENYRLVFFTNAAISLVGGLFFTVFVSGDIQEWDPAAERESNEI